MNINIRRLKCIRLWKIWNFFLIVCLYIYLIYDSIFRYVFLKRVSMDPAFGSKYSPAIMNMYLLSIIGGIMFIILSIYCLLSQNGNYGDDGIRLGRDTDNLLLYDDNYPLANPVDDIKLKKHIDYSLLRFKRHFLPLSCLLHYLSAQCFLIPLPFAEAHQIHQRVLTSNNLWHTDLDFLFHPDSWHSLFLFDSPSINWILRPQYFNLILSLVSMSIKYASVFWSCHKGFSFIFSFLMMLASAHVLLDYSTTTILIRLVYNPDFISESLCINFVSATCLMAMSFVGSTVILTIFWSIFEFGFQQYMETLTRYRHIVMMQADCSNNESNIFELNVQKRKHLYLRGYLPHITGICGCAVGIAMKIPLFYAGLNIVYKLTGDPLPLTNFLISIILISTWFITWFGFSLKPSWRFTLSNHSKTISDISSMASVPGKSSKKQSSEHINQVYSCLHNLDNIMTAGDNTLEKRLRNRDNFVDESDINNTVGCTNYVYLQSAMHPGLNQVIIPHIIQAESPLISQYVDNSIPRNLIHSSELSYDSATNIHSQFLPTIDYQIGRSQSQTLRNFGVLKYSVDSLRSQTKEYIPLNTDYEETVKFENCSSPDTSTLHAAESDTTLKYNTGSQQQLSHTVSMNRQNSNKKRTFGQRVTFKVEPSHSALDCSPNNSEQSSNNTTSSDSGVDFNSKQHHNEQIHSTKTNFPENLDYSPSVVFRSSGAATNLKYIPTSLYSAATTNNSQLSYDTVTSNQTLLNEYSENFRTENILVNEIDENSLSCISEDLPEQRMCSQV